MRTSVNFPEFNEDMLAGHIRVSPSLKSLDKSRALTQMSEARFSMNCSSDKSDKTEERSSVCHLIWSKTRSQYESFHSETVTSHTGGLVMFVSDKLDEVALGAD